MSASAFLPQVPGLETEIPKLRRRRLGRGSDLICLDCAKLKRENERLQAEVIRIQKSIVRMKEEIDLRSKDDTPQKTDS